MTPEEIFKSNITVSEEMFLETLAREHPKDIRVVRRKQGTNSRLEIDTQESLWRDYVVFMLRRFRAARNKLETLYLLNPYDHVYPTAA